MTSSRPRSGKPAIASASTTNNSGISPPKKKKGGNKNQTEDDDGEEETPFAKPGETQVTKRTLQNRKAQREFRKRREARVKDLEERVRRFDEMGLEANLQLQRTARRLKDENEALRGLIVRLGHGNMIQATLDGIGEPDIGYGSHGHAMGLTAPGSMDFASMGGNVNLTKPNASSSNQSNRKISLKKGSGKRKRGETVSEEEDDEEDDDEEEDDDGNEEEYQHQSKKNSSSRKPSNINTSTYGNQKDQFLKRATEVPKSAPPQKSTFDQDSVYNSAKNNGVFNFNNDWYPGFNQQVQQEQVKQQQQQLLHDTRLAKQANEAGPSRSPESSESLTSLSGSDPPSNSNTPVLATETPQSNNSNGVRRQSDELLTLNLSNQRNGNPSNNSQTTATSPQPNPYQQLQQSNPRPTTSGNPSQTSQGGLSTILNEYSRGGSGVSGSAMLGNNQNNGGFTAPTSQDRPSILRAGNNGPGGLNNGGGGNGGNIFPFIQPTHQNDALLNPNPIPFAFNLSNTSPPDQSWWNQMGGGMLTPGQDPNALDEKASAVAQALNGGNSNNNNNNNANNGGGSDNNGQRSQSPFDLSTFLTGGSSPGNNPFSISNFSGGNGMDGTQRFTPTSPFGNMGGIQRTSSRHSNSNPFESFGKFINSPSPSSNASGRSPSANASNSQPSNNNNTNNNTINRSSSSSSSSSATPFAQSEHAQTFLRLLERKISSMPGSDSPYTSLGFQPPMHSKMSNFYNNNQTSDQINNRNGLVRKDSGSSSGSDDSSSQKAALASTAASALEPNGVYSRLAKHPAFLSTNVQELEELVDAIGSNGKGKSPVLNGSTFSQQGTNNGKSILEENKDNVALLFGMLDRKSSYSSQANNDNNGGGGGQSPSAASPSPIARYAYGLTSPQLQHHHQLQQHLQMQQNRRS